MGSSLMYPNIRLRETEAFFFSKESNMPVALFQQVSRIFEFFSVGKFWTDLKASRRALGKLGDVKESPGSEEGIKSLSAI